MKSKFDPSRIATALALLAASCLPSSHASPTLVVERRADDTVLFRIVDGEKQRVLGKTAFDLGALRKFAGLGDRTAERDRDCSAALERDSMKLLSLAVLSIGTFQESYLGFEFWLQGQINVAEIAGGLGLAGLVACAGLGRHLCNQEKIESDRHIVSDFIDGGVGLESGFSAKKVEALERALVRIKNGRYRKHLDLSGRITMIVSDVRDD